MPLSLFSPLCFSSLVHGTGQCYGWAFLLLPDLWQNHTGYYWWSVGTWETVTVVHPASFVVHLYYLFPSMSLPCSLVLIWSFSFDLIKNFTWFWWTLIVSMEIAWSHGVNCWTCQSHSESLLLLLVLWQKLSILVNLWHWTLRTTGSWWSHWGCYRRWSIPNMLLVKVHEISTFFELLKQQSDSSFQWCGFWIADSTSSSCTYKRGFGCGGQSSAQGNQEHNFTGLVSCIKLFCLKLISRTCVLYHRS
jgi:hypothetical protein